MRKKLLVSLFVLTCSSCITVQNTRVVSVAGTMAEGGLWAETIGTATGEMSLSELIDFIEPQSERECAPIPGFSVCADDQSGIKIRLPARGGAVLQSADDFNKNKTALEQACRLLGNRCSFEILQAIQGFKSPVAKESGH